MQKNTSLPSTPLIKETRAVGVKRERSRSLDDPQPLRRLVTSGTKIVRSIPPSCLKSNPNHVAERKSWARGEVAQLKKLGLRVLKAFIRDDGLVIDWISPVHVWSDTLLPGHEVTNGTASVVADMLNQHAQSSARRSQQSSSPKRKKQTAHHTNPSSASLSPDRQTVFEDLQPTPPSSLNYMFSGGTNRRPGVHSISSTPPDGAQVRKSGTTTQDDIQVLSISPPLKSEEHHPPPDAAQDIPDQTSTIPDHSREDIGRQLDPSAAELQAWQTEMESLENSAIEFLQNFVKAFETDRSSLAMAYSRNASFSYQIHDIVAPDSVGAAFLPASSTSLFAPRKGRQPSASSGTHLLRTRVDIVPCLLSFGAYGFSGRDGITYDILAMSEPGPTRVLVVCSGYMVHSQQSHRISYDQSFLLQSKEVDEEDRVCDGLWPLVAIAHQLTIRDPAHLKLPKAR